MTIPSASDSNKPLCIVFALSKFLPVPVVWHYWIYFRESPVTYDGFSFFPMPTKHLRLWLFFSIWIVYLIIQNVNVMRLFFIMVFHSDGLLTLLSHLHQLFTNVFFHSDISHLPAFSPVCHSWNGSLMVNRFSHYSGEETMREPSIYPPLNCSNLTSINSLGKTHFCVSSPIWKAIISLIFGFQFAGGTGSQANPGSRRWSVSPA